MPKNDNNYICSLKTSPVFPYVVITTAKDELHAARGFLKHLIDNNYRLSPKTTEKALSLVIANPITEKHTMKCGIRKI